MLVVHYSVLKVGSSYLTAACCTDSRKPMSFASSATPWMGDMLFTFIFSNESINLPISSKDSYIAAAIFAVVRRV